jgi:hypothetical protein
MSGRAGWEHAPLSRPPVAYCAIRFCEIIRRKQVGYERRMRIVGAKGAAMRVLWGLTISLVLLAQAAAAQQSLADLARKERERKAAEQKSGVEVTTDELRGGQVDFNPPLDPARKGDLDYLLQQLSRPRATPELLGAFVPLKAQAVPRLLPLLLSTDPLKRVAPATVLTVLGNSEGMVAMARMLDDATAAAATVTGDKVSPDAAFRQRMEATREANHALDITRLALWRFTEGSTLAPEQMVQRLQKGPAIEIVGGPDNGQRLFNRALRDKDPNLRLGAVALIRAATRGKDFGFQPDQPPEQNEAAIQLITTFLTTERAKVMSALATKPK